MLYFSLNPTVLLLWLKCMKNKNLTAGLTFSHFVNLHNFAVYVILFTLYLFNCLVDYHNLFCDSLIFQYIRASLLHIPYFQTVEQNIKEYCVS
jgi:hypothetical protein